MLAGCIDIGSNTTRVLVAEVSAGRLTEVLARRVFTRLGKELRASGHVSRGKVAEVARVVAEHRELAEGVGTTQLRAVATAAIRGAANREELVAAIRERSGLEVHVLTGEEEARLAFLGATRTLAHEPDGRVGVVDVGGGSTEIAVGTLRGGVEWSTSLRIGSGFLADSYLREDPPSAATLHAMREHAAGMMEGLEVPHPDHAVAVGGSAASLRKVVGSVLEPGTVQRALRVLSSAPSESVAQSFGLDAERVRLMPAGLLLLSEAAAVLGHPLQIGRGGIREGICIELAARRG